jgi:hypothetical protein
MGYDLWKAQVKILCLDLSTTSSGFAVFNDGKLIRYGRITPTVKGLSKFKYPEAAYARIIDLSNKIKDLMSEEGPDKVLIEEVNRGINRIAQKSLDALHFFVLDRLLLVDPKIFKKIKYIDSNGKSGWRGKLGLKLEDSDKEWNKKAREFNKLHASGIKKKTKKKLGVIDYKDLAIRYVNKTFKLDLDVTNAGDEDIADAIALGASYVK